MFWDAKAKFFDVKPNLELDTAKELELLMHKFKEMSQTGFKANKTKVFN